MENPLILNCTSFVGVNRSAPIWVFGVWFCLSYTHWCYFQRNLKSAAGFFMKEKTSPFTNTSWFTSGIPGRNEFFQWLQDFPIFLLCQLSMRPSRDYIVTTHKNPCRWHQLSFLLPGLSKGVPKWMEGGLPLSNPLGFRHYPLEGAGTLITVKIYHTNEGKYDHLYIDMAIGYNCCVFPLAWKGRFPSWRKWGRIQGGILPPTLSRGSPTLSNTILPSMTALQKMPITPMPSREQLSAKGAWQVQRTARNCATTLRRKGNAVVRIVQVLPPVPEMVSGIRTFDHPPSPSWYSFQSFLPW